MMFSTKVRRVFASRPRSPKVEPLVASDFFQLGYIDTKYVTNHSTTHILQLVKILIRLELIDIVI